MSDLVERSRDRYRNRHGGHLVAYEAAAEIERLRAEIEDLKTELGIADHTNELGRKTIERLRADKTELLAALYSIERHTAPSTRTWDTCLRDMGLANDLARAAIAKVSK